MAVPVFEYMRWAKEQEERRWPYFLAASAMEAPSPEELGIRWEEVPLESPGGYGDPDLLGRIADRYALPDERVIITAGTSLANFLILRVALERGDEVILETPAYEALPLLVELCGARIVPLPRPYEDAFRIDPDRVRNAVTARTRLILLTSLHNPSGVALPEETLREIGEIASKIGALVLVDEVYLEYLPDGTFPFAASLGDPFVSTSSLTKAYGLGGLRIGWAAGPEEVIRKAHTLRDLVDLECAAPSQAMALQFFDRADEIRARILDHLAGNWRILQSWVESRDDLAVVEPDGGASAFPKILSGVSSEVLVRWVAERHETVVVPGEFFEAPGFIRIGFGGAPQLLEEGLRRVGEALGQLRGRVG